jgi:hypothetical protein
MVRIPRGRGVGDAVRADAIYIYIVLMAAIRIDRAKAQSSQPKPRNKEMYRKSFRQSSQSFLHKVVEITLRLVFTEVSFPAGCGTTQSTLSSPPPHNPRLPLTIRILLDPWNCTLSYPGSPDCSRYI